MSNLLFLLSAIHIHPFSSIPTLTSQDAMEEHTQNSPQAPHLKSVVDTSRPFRSVKEAVAIFGERFLAGELYAASPSAPSVLVSTEGSPRKLSPSTMKTREPTVLETLKKLEAELEETKVELQLLKERESGTETALASLNAELHRNMSKLAGYSGGYGGSKKTKMITEGSPTLAQILRMGERGGKREKKMEKKKPIIPLVADVIAMVKRSSSSQVCK